jgi:hypothetical protein
MGWRGAFGGDMRIIGGMFGKKHSEETKQKMSIAKKGRHISPNTEFKKGVSSNNPKRLESLPRGENHYKWNENVGYYGIHVWVKKVLGTPDKCDICEEIKSKRFMWHNLSGKYLRDVSDWQRVCAICHAHIHENWRKRWLA